MGEVCVITWWKLHESFYQCKMLPTYGRVDVSQVEIDFSVEIMVGLFFILAVGIFGITLVELLNNKLDWYITPLVNKVNRRYSFVVERNRLRTMNGHP